MKTQDLISKAVDIAGSQARLAELVGTSQPNIHRMANGRQSVSLELALRIERATGGAVVAEGLRPDLAELIEQWRRQCPERPAATEDGPAA